MSDYLYYSLDAWGRANPTSDEQQCISNVDCFGIDFSERKCCGSIALSEGSATNDDLFLYRGLDRGLIGASMEFTMKD